MTNDDETFDDFDFDNDDVKSVISSASTSRIFSVDNRMSKYQKNQSLRQFLNSPGIDLVRGIIYCNCIPDTVIYAMS